MEKKKYGKEKGKNNIERYEKNKINTVKKV